MYLQNFFPPLPLPDCPPQQVEEECDYPLKHTSVQICSTNINLLRRHKTRETSKPLGTLSCQAWTYVIFLTFLERVPWHLGWQSWMFAGKKKKKKNWCRPGLTASLTCSTERRCTEYLWLWTSCEFFFSCRHRCVEGISCRRGCVLRGTSAVYIKLFGVMSWWTAAASLAHQKHRHTRYKYFADVTVAQSSTPDSRRRT